MCVTSLARPCPCPPALTRLRAATADSIFRPSEENKPRVEQWQALADKHGVSLSAVAISFACLPTVVIKVIFGMTTPEEVEMNMASLEEHPNVPVEIFAEAQAQGLLPESLDL